MNCTLGFEKVYLLVQYGDLLYQVYLPVHGRNCYINNCDFVMSGSFIVHCWCSGSNINCPHCHVLEYFPCFEYFSNT